MRIKALVTGDDAVAEKLLLGVQDMSDASGIGLGTHGEHMQLVEQGEFL